MKPLPWAAALMALLAAGCGPKKVEPVKSSGQVTLDRFCAVPGLQPALRQTVLVIDETAVAKAPPAEMRVRNPALFQLVLGLGDPAQGVTSGAMAPRERVTLLLAPADGGAPRPVFTGCVPALTPEEVAAARSKQSGAQNALNAYFGGGQNEAVKQGADAFRRALLGALVGLGATPTPAVRPVGSPADAPLIRALSGAPQLAAAENGIPRLFIFTSLDRFTPPTPGDAPAARTAGFEAARAARLNLGRAELHLAGPATARDTRAREYAEAFFLASQADLTSWGGATLSALPAPPTRVEVYAGQIAYPPLRFPIQLRLAVDRNNTLVNSWAVVRTEQETATPINGALVCGGGVCRLTTDQSGLGQAWSPDPDAEPEFIENMALGGLRSMEAQLDGEKISGRVFDSAVGQIGPVAGTAALTFTGGRLPDGRL